MLPDLLNDDIHGGNIGGRGRLILVVGVSGLEAPIDCTVQSLGNLQEKSAEAACVALQDLALGLHFRLLIIPDKKGGLK